MSGSCVQLTGARTGEVALLRCAPGGGEKGARGDANEPRERNVEEQGLGFRGWAHTENQPTSKRKSSLLDGASTSFIHARSVGWAAMQKCGCKQRGARRGAWGAAEKMWVASRRSEQEPDGGLVVALAPVLLGRGLVFARLNIALPLMIRPERTRLQVIESCQIDTTRFPISDRMNGKWQAAFFRKRWGREKRRALLNWITADQANSLGGKGLCVSLPNLERDTPNKSSRRSHPRIRVGGIRSRWHLPSMAPTRRQMLPSSDPRFHGAAPIHGTCSELPLAEGVPPLLGFRWHMMNPRSLALLIFFLKSSSRPFLSNSSSVG